MQTTSNHRRGVRLRFMVHGSRVTVHGSLFYGSRFTFYGSFARFRPSSGYDNRMLHRRRVPEGAAGTERAWRRDWHCRKGGGGGRHARLSKKADCMVEIAMHWLVLFGLIGSTEFFRVCYIILFIMSRFYGSIILPIDSKGLPLCFVNYMIVHS